MVAAPGRAGALARQSIFSPLSPLRTRSWELRDRPRCLRATRAPLRALRRPRDPAAAEGPPRGRHKLARCLQRDAEARESAMRALRNVCLIGGDGGDVPGSNQAGTVSKTFPRRRWNTRGGGRDAPPRGGGVGDDPRRFQPRDAPAAASGAARVTDGGGIGAGIATGANGDAAHWRADGAVVSSSLRDVAVETLCAAASSGSRMCRAKLKEGGALEASRRSRSPRPLPDGQRRARSIIGLGLVARRDARCAWLADEP